MTRTSELLASFDAAWDRPWESLTSALKGVTEDEAAFQHAAYSDVPWEEGLPLPGSVLWYIAHLASCYRMYKAAIEVRPGAPPEFPPRSVTSLTEAIEDLKFARDELREVLANLAEEDFDDDLYWGNRIIDLARGTIRHDAWHAGQIVVARRLYRMRERRT